MPDESRLVVVGCGLQPARHASLRCVSEIRQAGIVFGLGDAFALHWMRTLNDNVHDLAVYYAESRDRRDSYRDMQRVVVDTAADGNAVCLVLYGHPGVFAQVGRKAMARARAQGIAARMEPGISAEACLYADLDLDPGERGVQSIEATQLLVEKRTIDPASLVLLWQVSQAGNLDCTGFDARPDRLALLVEKLKLWYPDNACAILYEAATLPVGDCRAESIRLAGLPRAPVSTATTLVIPPAALAPADAAMKARLRALDA